ncbi:MAG: hypothetical protein ABIH99_03060 [Candidatus Micrarchaeota archaeon]
MTYRKATAPNLRLSIRELVSLKSGIKELPEEEQITRFLGRVRGYHIPFTREGGEVENHVVFITGSTSRAKKISELFENVKMHKHKERGSVGYTGFIRWKGERVPVASIASGMGSGQIEIVVAELIAANPAAIIRYGSCGALKGHLKVGDLVIATFAVPCDSSFAWMTDEEVKRFYAPTMNSELVGPISRGLRTSGYTREEDERANGKPKYFFGGIQSKALLYAQEIGVGPRALHFWEVKKKLEDIPSLLASEMETALLYTMGRYYNGLIYKIEAPQMARAKKILFGSVNFLIGDYSQPFVEDAKVKKKIENKLIKTVPNVAGEVYSVVRELREL